MELNLNETSRTLDAARQEVYAALNELREAVIRRAKEEGSKNG